MRCSAVDAPVAGVHLVIARRVPAPSVGSLSGEHDLESIRAHSNRDTRRHVRAGGEIGGDTLGAEREGERGVTCLQIAQQHLTPRIVLAVRSVDLRCCLEGARECDLRRVEIGLRARIGLTFREQDAEHDDSRERQCRDDYERTARSTTSCVGRRCVAKR